MDIFQLIAMWTATEVGSFMAWLLQVAFRVINEFIKVSCNFMDWCVSFLPSITLPTFGQMAEGGNDFLALLNWFVPLDLAVSCLGLWLISETAYLALAPGMRLVRLLGR